jgi:hypothetical protein
VLLAVVAAGLAFTIARALAPSAQAPEPTANEPPQVAQPVQGKSNSVPVLPQPVPASPALVQSDRDLPAEVTLAPGKGLLEVNTNGKHRVYVDGVFVGPGPVRRIPLSPGTHDIRISLDGVDLSAPTQIREGRRTVLERSGGAPE